MQILFAGTPAIAVPTLDALAASGHEVVAVLTAPDRPSGRGRSPQSSAVKTRAVELGLTVLEPERLNSGLRREVAALEPDLLACFAYGKLFGPKFLSIFARGALNVHPSLLPRHRGPAPIPAAILAGDRETGVTIQAIARETDTGDIYAQERIRLDGSETTESLTRVASAIGARLLVGVVDLIEEGRATASPQDHSVATTTRLVRKEDGQIDWTLPALRIERAVRAYTPWPRAHTTLRGDLLAILEAAVVSPEVAAAQGVSVAVREPHPGRVMHVDKRLGILVETGNGCVALRKLQLQSRKPLDWGSFCNGVGDIVGTVLGGS